MGAVQRGRRVCVCALNEAACGGGACFSQAGARAACRVQTVHMLTPCNLPLHNWQPAPRGCCSGHRLRASAVCLWSLHPLLSCAIASRTASAVRQ